jgi:DNA polymerase (family 10)
MRETVRDIDILVSSEKPEEVMETFTKMENVKEVLARGATKSAIRTKDDVQVDVRVVEPESYGAALVYFTGSKAHNIHIRKIAIEKGWKVNEYGVFEEKTGRKLAGKSEEDVYRRLGLPYIPPELREDLGEIEAAQKGKLPRLIERSDIKGDLHVHSKWSDGGLSIEDMARAAQELGYEYIAITDHSKSLGIARGLSEKDVVTQLKEIEGVNRRLKNFTVLSGTEVDIKSDGSLDLSGEILERLDVVVAAVHSGFKQGRQTLTRRIIKAIENKHVDIIAHPTGRLMGSRDSYELDFDDIFKAASQTRTVFEINAYPERLDLTDINCRRAKEAGVLTAISTDAHAASQFENIKFGLAVARRGWLEKTNVVNCLSLNSLRALLRRRL